MRILTSQALAALDSGRFTLRSFLTIDMPGGVVGFWDDAYDIEISGQTYLATNGGFRISPVPSAGDLGVRSVDVVFSGLDGNVASQVEGEDWHQRAVTISLAIVTIDDPQIISLSQWFTGFADFMSRREQVGGTSDLVFRCEGIGRELARRGARTRSDSDQRQIDPDDGFFKHVVSSSNTPLQWGRAKPQEPPARAKPSGLMGLLDRIF